MASRLLLNVGVYTKSTDSLRSRLANVLAGVDVCPETGDPRISRRCPVLLTHVGAPQIGFAVESKNWNHPENAPLRVEIVTALAVREYITTLFADEGVYAITVAASIFLFSANAEIVDACLDLQTAVSYDVIVVNEGDATLQEILATLSAPVLCTESNRLSGIIFHGASRLPSHGLDFSMGDVSLSIRRTETEISLQAAIIMAAMANYSRTYSRTSKHGDAVCGVRT